MNILAELYEAEKKLAELDFIVSKRKIDFRMEEVSHYFTGADALRTLDAKKAYVDSQTEKSQRELAEIEHKARLQYVEVERLRRLYKVIYESRGLPPSVISRVEESLSSQPNAHPNTNQSKSSSPAKAL